MVSIASWSLLDGIHGLMVSLRWSLECLQGWLGAAGSWEL